MSLVGHKVFAIGHFKTGTTSYSQAMRLLGMVDLHFPRRYVAQLNATGAVFWAPGWWLPSGRSGGERWLPLSWDSMSNVNEVEYEECDEVYPDSKFVLTTRSVDSWLPSIRKHMMTPWPGRLRELFHGRFLKIFGCSCSIEEFDEAHFRRVFEEHGEAVRDYFSGSKSNQLLVLELESSDKMERLGKFLDKSVPYPKTNVTGRERTRVPAGAPGQSMFLGAGGLRTEPYQEAV